MVIWLILGLAFVYGVVLYLAVRFAGDKGFLVASVAGVAVFAIALFGGGAVLAFRAGAVPLGCFLLLVLVIQLCSCVSACFKE